MSHKKQLSPEQTQELLQTLKTRFEKNMSRHKSLEWGKIEEKLQAKRKKLPDHLPREEVVLMPEPQM